MQVSRRGVCAPFFRRFPSTILAAALSLFPVAFAAPSAAAAPRNDFDGDGYSDAALVSIASGGTLDWNVISGPASTPIASKIGFGKIGDHLTLGPWYTSAHASFAYVTLDGNDIVWTALKDDGTSGQKTFGTRGDVTVAGADFDGNGVADAATITTASNGKYSWSIHRNPFAPSKRKVQVKSGHHVLARKLPATARAVLGKSGDIPFYADPDGYGDWIGIVRSGGKSLYLRNLFTGRTKKIKLTAFAAGPLGAFPLKRASGGNFLLFPIRGDGVTDLYVTNAAGLLQSHAQIPSTGEILIGNFTDNSNAQVAIQDGGDYIIYSPGIEQTEQRTWGSGIAADAFNINILSGNVSPTPTPGGGGGGGGGIVDHEDNPPPPAGSFASICTTIHKMGHYELYKPGSGGTSDSRTGRPAFLWYDCLDQGVENLYVLATNGAVVGKFALYPVICPLVRFYSGWDDGSFDTGSELMSKALAASGSKTLYFYTKDGNCWGPVTNANGRAGGVGR